MQLDVILGLTNPSWDVMYLNPYPANVENRVSS